MSDKILGYCNQIDALTQLIRDDVLAVSPPIEPPIEPPIVIEPPIEPPSTTTVNTPAELIAALKVGGNIVLGHGGEFFNGSGFTVISNTHITAPNGGTLTGGTLPAVRVPPGSTRISIDGVTFLSGFGGAVVQLGDNVATTQGTADRVPSFITLTNIKIPTHRGKRGIEVNASDVVIENPEITDVYSTALADSQAICVLNSPGRIRITGGKLSAGSENILLGGDSMKVPGQVITNVLIENVHIYKPLSWQTDGINHAVKNLVEIKAGQNIVVRNCTIEGCWKASQDGYAFVITPKNAQFINTVLIDNCIVRDVAAGLQLLGEDYNTVTPKKTDNVKVQNTEFVVSKAKYGGRGVLALIIEGMQNMRFDNVKFKGDGSCILEADSKQVQGPAVVTNSPSMTAGEYGVRMPGSNYGDPIPPTSAYYNRRLIVEFKSNTISGAANKFKTNFPDNSYVTASPQLYVEQTDVEQPGDEQPDDTNE